MRSFPSNPGMYHYPEHTMTPILFSFRKRNKMHHHNADQQRLRETTHKQHTSSATTTRERYRYIR